MWAGPMGMRGMFASGEHAAGTCRFDLSMTTTRPAAAVNELLADIQDAEPIPRRARVTMVKEPSGPTGVGTRWHERVRLGPGWWLTVDSVVTEADEPHRLGMDFHSRWFTGHLTYDVLTAGHGSLLRQRETLRPRVLRRVLVPVLERRLGPRLEQRLVDLTQLLEDRHGS